MALPKMLATCQGDSLRDVRDRAVLMVGFACGGRRRSKIAGLRIEPLAAEEPVADADNTAHPSHSFHLGRPKTSSADRGRLSHRPDGVLVDFAARR